MADQVEVAEQPKNNPITGKPWTLEERAAQSRRAKGLVAQGRFGGAVAGSRKKLPAYAVIAAEAQRNSKALAKTLIDIASNGSTEKLKMDAIKMLIDIEFKALANRREEEEHLLSLPEADLRRAVLARIQELTGEVYDVELGEDDVDEDDEDASDDDEFQA